MAVLHQATLSPTKLAIVTDYLDMLGWGAGPVRQVGSYRYDDPEGEVGVEGILATRGSDTFHLPFTYRGEPLGSADHALVGTMDHSVLGRRWVYDGPHDPVYAAQLLEGQGVTRLDVLIYISHGISKVPTPDEP